MLRSGSARPSRAIEATLEHAAKAPFYARTWKRIVRHRDAVRLLSELPLLDKTVAAEHQEELLVPGVRAQPAFLEAGIVSSATTRDGRPLRVLSSPDELRPVRVTDPSSSRDTPRTLRLYSPRHGVPSFDAHRVFLPATLHPNTVDVLHDLLSGTGPLQFRHLVAPLSSLKWLSVALSERGLHPAAYQLQGLGTTGHALTAHARSWLEPLWKAPIFDNYSLSELRGHAHPCSACGYGHWNGAPTYFELVDPISGAPTTGPLGELVATTLVPSVQRMPLIRYRTGDVVELGPNCRRTGTRGVRFRGRLSQSLVVPAKEGARYLALSRDLQEVAEAQPDVALEPHPAEKLGRVPTSDIGVPRARIDLEAHEVHVELRYDPARFPDRAEALRQTLAEALFGPKPAEDPPRIILGRPGSVDVQRESLKLI